MVSQVSLAAIKKHEGKASYYNIRYHVIGRDVGRGMPEPWRSKDATGDIYEGITNPNAHFGLYEKHMKLLKDPWKKKYPEFMGIRKRCFCCDASKMELKSVPKTSSAK